MIFVKVFQNLAQYSGKVPISHWVSRIAVNTCRNQLMAEKARPELRHADLSEEQAAMLENLASDDALSPDRKLAVRDLVEKLLAMLKPVERLVIDMLYLQERSVAEVQKLTGWTAATIKIRAFRARQKLRKQIGGLL
jgi:RNA polymerase sigma factor (sigma-70 family)